MCIAYPNEAEAVLVAGLSAIHRNSHKQIKEKWIYIYIYTHPRPTAFPSRITDLSLSLFELLKTLYQSNVNTHSLSLWALYCHIIRLAMYVRSVLIFPCWLINQAGLSPSLTRTPRYENTKRASFSHPDWSLSGPPNNQRRTNVRGI